MFWHCCWFAVMVQACPPRTFWSQQSGSWTRYSWHRCHMGNDSSLKRWNRVMWDPFFTVVAWTYNAKNKTNGRVVSFQQNLLWKTNFKSIRQSGSLKTREDWRLARPSSPPPWNCLFQMWMPSRKGTGKGATLVKAVLDKLSFVGGKNNSLYNSKSRVCKNPLSRYLNKTFPDSPSLHHHIYSVHINSDCMFWS